MSVASTVIAPECHVWRAVLDDGSVVNVPIERIVDRHGVTWWRGVGSLVRCDTDRRAAMFALGPDRRDHLVELRAPSEKITAEQVEALRATALDLLASQPPCEVCGLPGVWEYGYTKRVWCDEHRGADMIETYNARAVRTLSGMFTVSEIEAATNAILERIEKRMNDE